MKKKTIIIAILLIIIIAGNILISRLKKEKAPSPLAVVGFSLGPDYKGRWLKDLDLFTKNAEKLGAEVEFLSAENNIDVQINQINKLVDQEIKTIVIVPVDPDKLVNAVDKAKKSGAKIIAYDQIINADIDYYVSFDNVRVGELEAQSIIDIIDKGKFAYLGGASENNAFLLKDGAWNILNPKINSRAIELVIDVFLSDWSGIEAEKIVRDYLENGGSLDAIVAANDDIAKGAISVLQEKGLAGQIPVSGQDADLSACQRIVDGTQTSTVYRPVKLLASKAAEVAVDMAISKEPETNSLVNNGKIDVPTYLLEPVLVTKENMEETVIKDNYYIYNEIYGNAE